MTRLDKAAFVLCCAALIFSTIAYGGVHQPVIAIFYFLVTLAGIATAVYRFKCGDIELFVEPTQLPLVFAAVYALLQIVPFGSITAASTLEGIPRTLSLDPYATWTTACQLIALSIFFTVLLFSLNSAARIRRFTFVIGIFSFGFAFFAILQSILSPDKIYGIYDVSYGAPFGSFVNRNSFAAYMEMTVALPLGLLFTGAVKKDKRLLVITAIVLMGVALLLCRSRGGFVAFIVEIILLFIFTRGGETKKGVWVRAFSIALLVIAIITGSVFVGGDTSLTRFADTAASEDFSTQRSHIWTISTKVITDNLPFGAGFGAFAVAYTKYDDGSGLSRVEQAHNDYLQVAADAGIPGILIGLLFLFLLFRHGRQALKINNTFRRGIALGALAGCSAVLVHSIFDFVLHVTAVALLFISLLALLSTSRREYADDIEDEVTHKRTRRRRQTDVGKAIPNSR